MALDFAIKDFSRKKSVTYPYVITISLIVALAIFMIYFTMSLGLNLFTQNMADDQNDNENFFSGAINVIYSQFNTLILTLILILAFVMVVTITTTLIITKKRDISIMKALGTLPDRLYWFYIVEAYIIFILGFCLGYVIGLVAFGIFAIIIILLGFKILLLIDIFYTSILFFSCFIGIFVITGYKLRKIGNKEIIKSFSKDIPYEYNASKKFTIIPRWLSSLGFNLRIAISNTIRRKGEFIRFFLIFSIIFLIIFTLGLGSIVLNTSTKQWIHKSQGEDIVVIAHKDVVDAYSEMYEMYSDPSITVDEDDIDFFSAKYLFSKNQISNLYYMDEIEEIDERLIKFCDVEEIDGYYYEYGEEGSGGYRSVGQQRKGNYPIMGVDSNRILQDFEVEGRFFEREEAYDNMTIGDGLGYNFFDYALDQSLKVKDLTHKFHICGVIIDSFYNGYAGYVGLDVFWEELNLTNNEINLVLLKIEKNKYDNIEDELELLIEICLGVDFTFLLLDGIFGQNLDYLSNLTMYPLFIIIIMGIISILSLYNYQKAGLIEKAKDFLIMRAIGTKKRNIRRILALESFFVIIPALLLSLGAGMIINSIFLIDRVYLPSIYIPFMGIALLFGIMIVFNYLSLIPIMKKIDNFNIKDFDMY